MFKVEIDHMVETKQVWKETDQTADGWSYDLLCVLAAKRQQERDREAVEIEFLKTNLHIP